MNIVNIIHLILKNSGKSDNANFEITPKVTIAPPTINNCASGRMVLRKVL